MMMRRFHKFDDVLTAASQQVPAHYRVLMEDFNAKLEYKQDDSSRMPWIS